MTTKTPAFRLGPLSLLAVLLACAHAFAQPLQLVSQADPALGYSTGGGGDSGSPIVSSDGRFVLFASSAENLVVVGTNSVIPARMPHPLNVYLRDRVTATTTLISVDTSGLAGGDGDSLPMGISTNNRYALFESSAGNLVPGDTNGTSDVFVRDLQSGITILVSANTNGAVANGASTSPSMTPDGRHVAFASSATDLVAGDTNRLQDVFVRDLQTGSTVLVSAGATSTSATAALGGSDAPAMTPDGRLVSFLSSAKNLAPDVAYHPGLSEVYVRDMTVGTTAWASADARAILYSLTIGSNYVTGNHAISEDGQFVVYEAAKDSGSAATVFRYHVPTGVTLVIHTNSANLSTSDGALAITSDASRVAFVANVGETSGYTTAVLVWDAGTGATILASEPLVNDIPEFSEATAPVLDQAGRYVAFLSNIPGLVTNQIAEGYHVYVRDLEAGQTMLAEALGEDDETALDVLGVPSLSADGRIVAFSAPDGFLVADDNNGYYDVFLRDLQAATNELVSTAYPAFRSITPDGVSSLLPGSASADGRYVVFRSLASDLVAEDLNSNYDVFVRDLEFGTTELISVSPNEVPGNGNSSDGVTTPDGRYVAFVSYATDLVPGLSNFVGNVFVRDRLARTTVLASINYSGSGGGNYDSTSPMISSDGRFVFFYSTSFNLVEPAPGYGPSLVNRLYMRDLQTATTHLVAPNRAFMASMTPDGRLVACTAGSSLVSSQIDRLYVWDALAARRVYTNSAPSHGFTQLAISPNGQRIAYATNVSSIPMAYQLYALDWAANTNWLIAPLRLTSQVPPRFSGNSRFLTYTAVEGTTIGTVNHVYLYDFDTGTNVLLSRAYLSGTNANGHSDSPDISADGRFVAYESQASDLVPGDTNGAADIFVYDRLSGSTTLITANRSGTASADNFSTSPRFSPDGKMLFFDSWASDLLPQPVDFNNNSDVFAYRIHSSGDIPLFQASMSFSSAGAFITWPVVFGKTYRVQYKNNLGDSEWQDVAPGVTMLGSQGRLHLPAPVGRTFYRVVGF